KKIRFGAIPRCGCRRGKGQGGSAAAGRDLPPSPALPPGRGGNVTPAMAAITDGSMSRGWKRTARRRVAKLGKPEEERMFTTVVRLVLWSALSLVLLGVDGLVTTLVSSDVVAATKSVKNKDSAKTKSSNVSKSSESEAPEGFGTLAAMVVLLLSLLPC